MIQEGNILIAKSLNWEYYQNTWDVPYTLENKHLLPTNEELKFHSDSNWQWVALEKIAQIENNSIGYLFTKFNRFIDSKQDLFEAIVNYFKNQKI
jgi:hypothetical protein